MNLTCKFCSFSVSENYYFCPNCGKKLKEPPFSISIAKQIGIYALSFFLPPLGLWPGIKYLLQKNRKAKIVGIITIILTIVSTFITIYLTINLLSNPLALYSAKQLKELQYLGY